MSVSDLKPLLDSKSVFLGSQAKQNFLDDLAMASFRCKSEELHLREEGFKLFLTLLSKIPENSMDETLDALIRSILIESRRLDPCGEMIELLEELIGRCCGSYEISSISQENRKNLDQRWEDDERWECDMGKILFALTRLSVHKKNQYWIGNRAANLKQLVENEIVREVKKSQNDFTV